MKPTPPSTRRVTQDTGNFTRSTEGSRSLERGLQLLREYKLGTSILTNADLAERTGLPRPTVSRLTKSLVDGGFLLYDVAERAYRLSPVVLSLADAYRFTHQVTEIAQPMLHALAQEHHVNVSLGVADRTEIVYLVSVRHSPDSISKLRRVVTGTRVPIERTAVGLAYLAALPPRVAASVIQMISPGGSLKQAQQREAIEKAVAQTKKRGYGIAAYLPGNAAVGRTFIGPDKQLYGVNISFEERPASLVADRRRYAELLRSVLARLSRRWQQ